MPDDLQKIAPTSAKGKEIASMGITPEPLLNQKRQAIHAAPHVGPPHRQPDPDVARHRDHRPSALTTAAASSGGVDAGIRIRMLANSTSITAMLAETG